MWGEKVAPPPDTNPDSPTPANQIGSNTIGAGNARASGYIGSTNAMNNGLSNAFSQYQNNQLLTN
jgi:hypothetical protein